MLFDSGTDRIFKKKAAPPQTKAAIKSFREPLDKASAKYKFVAYPGVVHSFTVPGADARNLPGMKYDKQADEDSWKRMTQLFAEQFGK